MFDFGRNPRHGLYNKKLGYQHYCSRASLNGSVGFFIVATVGARHFMTLPPAAPVNTGQRPY